MSNDRVARLVERFVWVDTVPEGPCKGLGWSQFVYVGPDKLQIFAEPRPEYLTSNRHGLSLAVASHDSCLLIRHTCDPRRVKYLVLANMDQAVDLLLECGSRKVGVAADVLVAKLAQQKFILLSQ